MKLEIAESLCCSYLRHVKRCWIVQANWKVSEHWDRNKPDDDLEKLFASMRVLFDKDGSVFGKTKNAQQFLKQGEIDVVGVEQDGTLHVIDIAFHEAGLNYTKGTRRNVLKKLLRMVMILKAYQPEQTGQHIYFVSPVVNPSEQESLEQVFLDVETQYPEFEWRLLTNERFKLEVLEPTLEKAGSVADTSELFMRAAKLLELADSRTHKGGRETSTGAASSNQVTQRTSTPGGERLQPRVRQLMTTLLDDYPTLLSDSDRDKMLDNEQCKTELGLQIANHTLLRHRQEGKEIQGHSRYYSDVYGGEFYLCSQWWKDYHAQNARSLERFVASIIERKNGHPGVADLERHRSALQAFSRERIDLYA